MLIPSIATEDRLHVLLGNAVLDSETPRAALLAGHYSADFSDRIPRKNGMGVPFTGLRSVPTTRHGISDVICLRSGDKMSGVAAGPVVAGMPDNCPACPDTSVGRELPVGNFICDTMSVNAAAMNFYPSIAIRFLVTSPLPTLGVTETVDSHQETCDELFIHELSPRGSGPGVCSARGRSLFSKIGTVGQCQM